MGLHLGLQRILLPSAQVSSLTTGSITLPSARGAFIITDYESISTTTVGAGGSSSITFTSIPTTFTHLQVRVSSRSARSASSADEIYMTINGNSLTKNHYLLGTGSAASAGSATAGWVGISTASSAGAGTFGISIIDIFEYKNTNKNKTVKSLTGFDTNGGGEIYQLSNFINSTSTITSLTFTCSGANTFAQYTSFALYGVGVA